MVQDIEMERYVKPFFMVAVAGALLMVALISGYCARSHGRSFWGWFTLSLVLPGVSYFVLFGLILHQELNQGQRLLKEARAILAAAAARAAHPEEL